MSGGRYRIEISSTNRAGCQNTECKKEAIKIQKGQIRFGTFVTIQDHQSWRWKHWGCVTPKQVENLSAAIEGNLDYLDGYEDLPENVQERVRNAIEDGHIPDEDWTGDLEMNRDGMSGYRMPASMRKKMEKAEREASEESASPTKPKFKKRSRIQEDPDREEVNDEPTPKKSKASQKGKNVKTKDEDDDHRPAKPSKRGKEVNSKPNDGWKPTQTSTKRKIMGKKIKTEESDDDTGATVADSRKVTKLKTEEHEGKGFTNAFGPQTMSARKVKTENDAVNDGQNSLIKRKGPHSADKIKVDANGAAIEAYVKPKSKGKGTGGMETGMQTANGDDQDDSELKAPQDELSGECGDPNKSIDKESQPKVRRPRVTKKAANGVTAKTKTKAKASRTADGEPKATRTSGRTARKDYGED